jgi:hypothetical protein
MIRDYLNYLSIPSSTSPRYSWAICGKSVGRREVVDVQWAPHLRGVGDSCVQQPSRKPLDRGAPRLPRSIPGATLPSTLTSAPSKFPLPMECYRRQGRRGSGGAEPQWFTAGQPSWAAGRLQGSPTETTKFGGEQRARCSTRPTMRGHRSGSESTGEVVDVQQAIAPAVEPTVPTRSPPRRRRRICATVGRSRFAAARPRKPSCDRRHPDNHHRRGTNQRQRSPTPQPLPPSQPATLKQNPALSPFAESTRPGADPTTPIPAWGTRCSRSREPGPTTPAMTRRPATHPGLPPTTPYTPPPRSCSPRGGRVRSFERQWLPRPCANANSVRESARVSAGSLAGTSQRAA